jgi:hypothetical protein
MRAGRATCADGDHTGGEHTAPAAAGKQQAHHERRQCRTGSVAGRADQQRDHRGECQTGNCGQGPGTPQRVDEVPGHDDMLRPAGAVRGSLSKRSPCIAEACIHWPV